MNLIAFDSRLSITCCMRLASASTTTSPVRDLPASERHVVSCGDRSRGGERARRSRAMYRPEVHLELAEDDARDVEHVVDERPAVARSTRSSPALLRDPQYRTRRSESAPSQGSKSSACAARGERGQEVVLGLLRLRPRDNGAPPRPPALPRDFSVRRGTRTDPTRFHRGRASEGEPARGSSCRPSGRRHPPYPRTPVALQDRVEAAAERTHVITPGESGWTSRGCLPDRSSTRRRACAQQPD